ncbi:cilia- and flagella-associated protein 58-like [Cololabis saira]|uniref:cilia- and flagella-associated protein 58-like n=1 Tax=Cololabis saira TaxID=129043 RepID=UPI002AD42944|nr:cilia- and flagella-associated protein 58-like [Cololabis saira]
MEELRLSGEDSSESLEEFQMVLRELDADKSMDKIRVEYEKLILPLKKSRENEKRLMSKCRELKAEIVSSSTKVAAALKLSEGDEATITSLKIELDKALQMVDAAHDKERKDSEIIRNIKEDVSNLTQKSDLHTAFSSNQGQRDLLKKIEELTEKRDQLMKTSEDLREKLNKSSAALQQIETKRDTAVHKISQLQQDLLVQQNEIFRETRLKETLDKEVKQLHAGVEAKMREVKALNLQGQQSREEQQRLERQLKDLRVLHERSTKVLEQIQLKKNGLQQQYEQLSSDKQHFLLQNQQMANQLKIKEEEVSHMLQDVTKQTKMREAIQKKLQLIEDQKADVEVQRETLKAHIVALEKELESSQMQVEADKKAQEELIRERDVLNKNMIKAVQSAENLEHDKKTLEHEISIYQQEAQKQREIIQQMEKERDSHINETSGLMQKVQQKMNDAEAKEIELFDRKKEVTEAEYKLKQQENLLVSVISERNLRSKNLLQATVEIVDMKTRMKSKNYEVTLLKKPALASRSGQQEHKSLEKYNKALKEELQSMKLQLEEAKQHVDSQRAEQQKLQKVISDTEAEQDQHKKQLEQVMRERNNLSRQLLHCNDERALLYEKIRIHQSILNKGDFHYKQKLEDIHLLKLEVKRLQCKKKTLDKSLPNIEELRQELFQLEKELLRERSRNSVPEETNIHRWRQLEDIDPSKYDLIQKIQVLQRRLISKTKELEKQELSLQEEEKLYMELKQILARRPGPEAAEQLQQCRWTLRDRSKKLKALTAEVRMLESQMDQYKSENGRLDNDLADIKKKYLCNKKLLSEQRTRTKVEKIGTLPPLPSRPQLTGGGFGIHWPVGQ